MVDNFDDLDDLAGDSTEYDELNDRLTELTEKCDHLTEGVEGISAALRESQRSIIAELRTTAEHTKEEIQNTQRGLVASAKCTLGALQESHSGLIGVVVVVGVVAGLAFGYMSDQALYPRVKSYPAVRQSDGTLKPLSTVVYRVNLLTDTVTYWTPGRYETPYKLQNCTVRDKKNWIGYYPFGGTVEMQKGKVIKQHDLAKQDPNEIYIGRFHWSLLHLGLVER